MALTKKVNGEEVVLDPAEEAAVLAEWAANDPTDPAVIAAKRQEAIDLAKDKMNGDPVFATIAQAVAVLKATADGTTVNQAKQALLADLETRI